MFAQVILIYKHCGYGHDCGINELKTKSHHLLFQSLRWIFSSLLCEEIVSFDKFVLLFNFYFLATNSSCQINRVISHPTLPISITAHEDRHIKFYDNNTGKNSLKLIIIEKKNPHYSFGVCQWFYSQGIGTETQFLSCISFFLFQINLLKTSLHDGM